MIVNLGKLLTLELDGWGGPQNTCGPILRIQVRLHGVEESGYERIVQKKVAVKAAWERGKTLLLQYVREIGMNNDTERLWGGK